MIHAQCKRFYYNIHFLFFILALPTALLYAVVVPPFQVPDEFVHFAYASGISEGQFVPHLIEGDRFGGNIPAANGSLMALYQGIPFHREAKVTAALNDKAMALHYDGMQVSTTYSAAAIYPPTAYIVPGFALFVSRIVGLSPLQAFYVGRIANAVTAISMFAIAIRILPFAKVPLAAISSLPMVLYQTASYSADPMAFGLTSIIVSLLAHSITSKSNDTFIITLPSIILGFLIGIKLPMVPLVFPLICMGLMRKRYTETAFSIVACGALVALSHQFVPNFQDIPEISSQLLKSGIRPQQQFMTILNDPLRVFLIAESTIRQNIAFYYESAVGVFGWLDTYMPKSYYYVIALSLFLAATAALFDPKATRWSFDISMVAAATLCAALIFGAFYLYWTPLGQVSISGVQGRYFIPVLMMTSVAIPTVKRSIGVVTVAYISILVLQELAAIETFRIIIARFYIA